MSHFIDIAAVEDNRMLVDSLWAWASDSRGIRLKAVTSTVEELLRARREPVDVVLLDAALRAEPDPAGNVRRLIDAGHRVLVIDGSAEPISAARALATGADGYLTRDHDLAALAETLHAIAADGRPRSPGATVAAEPDGHPLRPPLSERERAVLMAYASGRTLDSTARHLGISVETARTYLKRVKAKYQQAGLPAYTKVDLAERVRADWQEKPDHGKSLTWRRSQHDRELSPYGCRSVPDPVTVAAAEPSLARFAFRRRCQRAILRSALPLFFGGPAPNAMDVAQCEGCGQAMSPHSAFRAYGLSLRYFSCATPLMPGGRNEQGCR